MVHKVELPTVREYGCCLCQKWHVRELEPELYERHLYHQSKHGYGDRAATVAEIFAIEMEKGEKNGSSI